jgi:hypothetical protein
MTFPSEFKQTLAKHPALSWDQATSEILDEILE